ncbi:MAG TPA: hypothetical protein VFA07_12485 [Chthonomonadaceae bacterium]|nr:hypothetical protein [Chthonomonadaceae bacterium]
MTQATLAHILKEIKTLERDELQQVQQAIQERLASNGYSEGEACFHQALIASGLVVNDPNAHS